MTKGDNFYYFLFAILYTKICLIRHLGMAYHSADAPLAFNMKVARKLEARKEFDLLILKYLL